MAKTIKLEHITKIEGHANLTIAVDGNKIKKCELGAVEGFLPAPLGPISPVMDSFRTSRLQSSTARRPPKLFSRDRTSNMSICSRVNLINEIDSSN